LMGNALTNFSLLRPAREANERRGWMGRSSGFRIILLAAPSQHLFGASGVSGHRKFEGGDPQRLSSPVTAARQRRILTGLPGTHPQPSRCLEGSSNYSGGRNSMQGFSPQKASVKLAVQKSISQCPQCRDTCSLRKASERFVPSSPA